MNTFFSSATRILMCNHCGAPLEAAVAGGTFACRYCNAANQVVPRDDQVALVAAPQFPVNEQERLARLRSQDGKPLIPPASIQPLLQGNQIAPWKIQEAVSVWQSSRQELRATGNYECAERLLFLTMLLSQHFFEQNDLMRQRALFESALDVFTLPRHRQIMRGYLARSAARTGDLAAAEQWLAPCDQHSDDLQSDSTYRFSRAFIDTCRGNWGGVLQALGQTNHDVPIMDAQDAVCAALRANAWERLGQVQTAVNLLSEFMQTGGAQNRQSLAKVIELYKDVRLCEQSYRAADSQHSTVAGQIAAKRASGGIHVVFVPLGIAFAILGLLSGVGAVVLAVGAAGLLTWIGWSASGTAMGGFAMTLGILAITFLPMGVIFAGIGFAMRKAAQRAERLRVHGVRAVGRIANIAPTGMSINNVPQMQITLIVEVPGQSPYQATTKMLLSPYALAQVGPGAQVPLRVDPQNPNDVLIETD